MIKDNLEWLEDQIDQMSKEVKEEVTKVDPVKARKYASINCIFYNACRDAICKDIKLEMSCHECEGVIEKNCFMKELDIGLFVNKDQQEGYSIGN